jgi:hypothetical protein
VFGGLVHAAEHLPRAQFAERPLGDDHPLDFRIDAGQEPGGQVTPS